MPIDDDRKRLKLQTWLLRQGYIPIDKDDRDRSTASYTFLDGDRGGVAYVPDTGNAAENFWTRYLDDIMAGYHHYVNERVSMHSVKAFPMFFDLDFDNEEKSKEDIARISRLAQMELRQYFPEMSQRQKLQKMRMIVAWVPHISETASDTDTADTTDSTGSTCPTAPSVKTGIHLIFPELIVSQATAFQLQEGVRCRLERMLGERPVGCKPWTDVVDPRVYIHPSLRVLYSCKAVKCPRCQGAGTRRDGPGACSRCLGAKKVNAGRVYQFFNCYKGDGSQDTSQRAAYIGNKMTLLLDASIRRPFGTKETDGFTMYQGAPQFVPFTKTSLNDLNQRQFHEDRLASSRMRRSQAVDRRSRAWELMLEAIRDYHETYRDIQIKNFYLKQLKSGDTWVVTTQGHGSSSCQNLVGRDHKSNTIYFTATRRGLQQRCWCRCQDKTDRVAGFCKDFQSTPQPLGGELMGILFPGGSMMNQVVGISLNGPMGRQAAIETLYGIHCKNVESARNPNKEATQERSNRVRDEHEKAMTRHVISGVIDHAKECEAVSREDLAGIKRTMTRNQRVNKKLRTE